jgi:drug/metabolite transporter (DMT)-like permease
VLWGALFLDERIGVHHIAGAAMILAGISLVARVEQNGGALNPPESSRS